MAGYVLRTPANGCVLCGAGTGTACSFGEQELRMPQQGAGAGSVPATSSTSCGELPVSDARHARKLLQGAAEGQTLVQGAGELTATATPLLASPPPPPPPPPFVFVSAAPAEEPAIEPLSLTTTQAASLTEVAPAPEAAALPAKPVPELQPTASRDIVPVPKKAPANTPAPTQAAPVTPAPTKAAAPQPVPRATPQPAAGKSAQLAEQQTPGSYAAQPTALVPGAGVPLQPPPPPTSKNPTPADLALAAGPAVEMHGFPPAPPLAPPAKRRAPFTPIVGPTGACSTPYAVISSNPQLSRFNDYIVANALQGALSPNNQSLTVFAPVNDAFNVQAFEVPFYGCTNITCLLNVHPEVGRSLVAYATLPDSVSTAQLSPGTVFNTTAAISLTPITITVAQPSPLTGQITLDGRGSDAAVLQGDLSACGADSTPSYVHVVDTVLLPFLPSMTGNPNAAGTAYSATAPSPGDPAPTAAAAAITPIAEEVAGTTAAAAPAADPGPLGTPGAPGTTNADLMTAGRRRAS